MRIVTDQVIRPAVRTWSNNGVRPLVECFWKPWFVHRPSQLVRRALVTLLPPAPGYQPLRTSWGLSVTADPTKTIGRSIATTGVYDIAVSEALLRLIQPSDLVFDAGANVGYMTLLMSMAAGPGGSVVAFEPHPDLFDVLRQNAAAARAQSAVAPIDLHNAALGAAQGSATLVLPAEFDRNDGIARISDGSTRHDGDQILTVAVDTLDRILGDRVLNVLKLDVEGFELQVLQGGARALQSQRIRHIVFEDHHVEASAVVRFLQNAGYRVYSLGWSVSGITVSNVEGGSLAATYEAPNYIASLAPADVEQRCAVGGWHILKDLAVHG